MCDVFPEGSNCCMCFHRVVEVDERYMREWVEFGLAELTTYLHKQAAFAAYCERREAVR